ncbi:MAG: sensor domain-containing diguanylate cyclase [Deltaproteobacteria bacterium]|nr:sensor domain-containing diguanylate cyclase [Myxococcales bacterium]MDP3214033.1 sensor domain-containing diguanylate cyclase [Deltaproteobacteria bacterium]
MVVLFGSMRRVARVIAAPAVTLAVAARIAGGAMRPPAFAVVDGVIVGAGLVGLVIRLVPGSRAPAEGENPPLDLGAAALILALGYALTAALGGLAGPLSALPLLVLAAAVALGHPRRAWVVALSAVLLELALHRAGHATLDVPSLAMRLAVVLGSAALHFTLTRAEVARVRAHARSMLHDERRRQRDSARSLRLGAAASQPGARPRSSDDARNRGSLEEIHASLVGLLNLTRRTMHLRTCALLWVDAKAQHLRLVEAATDDAIQTELIPAGAGALGAVMQLGRPVALAALRPDYAGLPYYPTPSGVRCFAGVPVIDDDAVRGVLAADRDDDRPFTPEEQATLESVALQARRLINNERVFARLERIKNDMTALFEASRSLGEALTEDQCLAALTNAARAIVPHDLLVFTAYDPNAERHRVRHVAGEAPAGLAATEFADNGGLVAAAVRARVALPYRGQLDPKTQFVFTKAIALKTMASVLVLPLVARDKALGTLTLCAQRKSAFPDAIRQLLGVLASHASVTLANAASVRRLEEMATTDPMTGHLNKRALETEFEQRLRSAARFGRTLGLIVLDIDKFKTVNDTYGHAFGDVVIKGLGAVLTRCRRETDVIARFGGEEFVVVCEQTDAAGTFLLAERIREELQREVFHSEHGAVKVTCSLGVSAFPGDGDTRGVLFERADQALYAAKHNGRNQTRSASPIDPSSDAARRPAARRAPKPAPAKVAKSA